MQTSHALQKKNGGTEIETTATEEPSSDRNYNSHEKCI